jgi:cytochrome c553
MKPRIVGLAVILLGFVGSAGSAETPTERGAYLVNTIGACGNCHAPEQQQVTADEDRGRLVRRP